VWFPLFQSSVRADGGREYRVGHELVDEFLEFASGRARPNTVRAYAHDLSVFFGIIRKEPKDVTTKDVLRFVTVQRQPRKGAENVLRISDGGSGLSTSTIKRRLAAVSSLFGYLVVRGDAGVATNPVPRGLPTRRNRHRGEAGAPLVRGVRRLPRILNPDEVEALMAALRTDRDRAMAQACCSAGCAVARCSVCDSKTFASVSGASSSPMARVGTNVWCRSRPPSSPRWRTT
jgi:integrase/recombinase XerD